MLFKKITIAAIVFSVTSSVFAQALYYPITQILNDSPTSPAVSTCVDLSVNLQKGSKDSTTGGQVSDLQFFLQDQGFLDSEPTGFFGALTYRAVIRFQNKNGISGSGYVGALTRATIKKISCGSGSGSTDTNSSTLNSSNETKTSPQTSSCTFGASFGGVATCLPTGYITASSCFIPVGGSSCALRIGWTANNAKSPEVSFTASNNTSGVFSRDANGDYSPSFAPVSITVYLKDGTTILDSKQIASSCVSGSFWDGTMCSTSTTKAISPTGFLSASGCTIPAGMTSCAIGISWRVVNQISPEVSFTASNNTSGVFSRDAAGEYKPFFAPFSATIYLKDNGSLLDKKDIVVACATGTSWNGSTCAFPVPVTVTPTGSLNLSSCTIPAGGSSCAIRIAWSINNAKSPEVSFTASNNTSGVFSRDANGDYSPSFAPVSITVYLKDSGTQLDSKEVSVTCASGTSWDGNKCASSTGCTGGASFGGTATCPVSMEQSLSPRVLGASTSYQEEASCTRISKNIRRGDESNDTKALQSFLNKKGLLSGDPTGFYGDKTVLAVKAYQTSKGIPATGMTYEVTRSVIEGESCR